MFSGGAWALGRDRWTPVEGESAGEPDSLPSPPPARSGRESEAQVSNREGPGSARILPTWCWAFRGGRKGLLSRPHYFGGRCPGGAGPPVLERTAVGGPGKFRFPWWGANFPVSEGIFRREGGPGAEARAPRSSSPESRLCARVCPCQGRSCRNGLEARPPRPASVPRKEKPPQACSALPPTPDRPRDVGRLRALSGPWLLPVKWGARRSRERGTRERRWRPTPGHAHTRGRPWRDGGRRRHVRQRVQLLSRSWKNEAQRGVNT